MDSVKGFGAPLPVSSAWSTSTSSKKSKPSKPSKEKKPPLKKIIKKTKKQPAVKNIRSTDLPWL